jgi:hypothetical protein
VSLRSLDDRWLPTAAQRLRSAVDRSRGAHEQLVERAGRFDLQSLDDRWARGPLRGFRDRPQLALAVAAALLVAGVGTAAVREQAHEPKPQGAQQTDVGPSSDGNVGHTLGPAVGANTEQYVSDARQGLIAAVQKAPGSMHVALVSLTDYRTPEQAAALLNGFAASRAFLRARAGGRDATPLPVEIRGRLLPDLRKAYVETARSRRAAQQSYRSYAETLKGTSKQDQTFRDLYAAFARASGIEAREYAHDCACVYAVVVVASAAQLLTLSARPGVRAVEVAATGVAVGQVQFQPLLPEITGRVPRPSFGGQS